MFEAIIEKRAAMAGLLPEWQENLLPEIRSQIGLYGKKIVVLDDDPTGTQTVHGLPVLTGWSVEMLKKAILMPQPAFFVLTNSRSLARSEARELGMEIGSNLKEAVELLGISIEVISRSDSTLRGHFPYEVDAVAKTMGMQKRPYLIVPFFPEGGRFTIGDVHYVAEDDRLVPAAQTAYAQDAAFGFTRSNLKEWIAEKTGDRIPFHAVTSVSLEDIRQGGPDRVGDILSGVNDRSACIANAASYRDVEVLVSGLGRAAKSGRRFLLRTAAAFVRVMTGIEPRQEFLSREELVSDTTYGGLFVVGSYVPKTTAQVRFLLEQTDIAPVEVKVRRLLDGGTRDMEIKHAAAEINTCLEKGQDVVLYTSRELVSGNNAKRSLDIGQVVSDSLIEIVRAVRYQPRYLVAKGGITSADVATKGLGIRRAMVVGQVIPGVPVWQMEEESLYPGMSYIVFPGNVGDEDALVTIQKRLA